MLESENDATAVDGQTVTKIFGTVAVGATAIQIYSGQGLTITFSCPTSGNDQVVANGPAAATDNLVWQGNGSAGTTDPFQGRVANLGPSSNTVIGDGNYGAGVATSATAAGNVVTVSYGFDDAHSGVTSDCSVCPLKRKPARVDGPVSVLLGRRCCYEVRRKRKCPPGR